MGFGEVVLVMSVAGQNVIKLNKCTVLSQIRSGRAWGKVSLQEHFRAGLFLIAAFSREMQCDLFTYFFIICLVEVSILKCVSSLKQSSTPATGAAALSRRRLDVSLRNNIASRHISCAK